MDAARWNKIKTLFEQVLDQPEAEQARFAAEQAEQAGFDAEMVAELQALLEADRQSRVPSDEDSPTLPDLINAAPDLVAQAGHEIDSDARTDLAGQQFGRWRIVHEIGRGGMGTVFLAERSDSDFHQLGALKLVESALPTDQLQRRFRDERRILATLDHPGIARLLDGDEGPDGQPFLVMEFVDGQPIDRYCVEHELGLRQRLELLIETCLIVADAHQRLVVHRDLKPSNILVDQQGRVRLLDFGIAKLIEQDGEAAATATRQFTPEYAAPEQVRGEPATTSVDVHALGLLMYQLLTGSRPWSRSTSEPFAYEQAILNETPTLPSRMLATLETGSNAVARPGRPDLKRMSSRLRGDLDAIVMKALRKEANARYVSAMALAEDIQRYLDRQPVLARRGNWRYQAQRFLARHALASALVVALVTALAGGLGLALWQAEVARGERDHARLEALTAERSVGFLTDLFHMANPAINMGEQITARELLDRGVDQIQDQLHDEPAVRSRLLLALGQAHAGLEQYQGALDLFEQALELADDSGQPLLVAEVLIAQASVIRRQGDTSTAIDLLQQVLALPLPSDTRGEQLRGRAEWRLAVRLQELSKLDQAEHYYLQGSRRLEKAGSPVPPQGWIPYSSLLGLTGRNQEAEALLRSALESLDPEDQSNFLHRANLLSQHAGQLIGLGRNDEAIAQMREAVAAKIKVYGHDHHSLDITRHNLATHLADIGQNEEAETIFNELLQSLERRHGDQHPTLAASRTRLARLYQETGRVEASIPLFMHARDAIEARMGVQSFTTGTVNTGLGRAYLELGQMEAARSALADAVIAHEHNPKAVGFVRSLIDLTHIELADSTGPTLTRCQQLETALELVTARRITHAYGQFVLGRCLLAQGQSTRGLELKRAGLATLRELASEDMLERRLAEQHAEADQLIESTQPSSPSPATSG
jgi:eukaryotic-like serine/threonine-protein kinase